MAENLESGIPDLVEAAKHYYATEGTALPESASSASQTGAGRLATA
jgi:hypothetical protein